MGAEAWRVGLIAFLLFVGPADFAKDLKGDHSEDSRTGYLSANDNGSNESDTDGEVEPFEGVIVDGAYDNIQPAIRDTRRDNVNNVQFDTDIPVEDSNFQEIIKNQEKVGPFVPGPLVHEYRFIDDDESVNVAQDETAVNSGLGSQHITGSEIPVAPVRDDLVFPVDPNYEAQELENQYPLSPDNGSKQSIRSTRHRLISRLIPLEDHILLHNIPGAYNAIHCSRNGELHNFWAPSFQCMVCVCLGSYGRLRPVCVSCTSCIGPPKPPPTPYTTPVPYTTPSPEEKLSCKPLPVNIPFQSPLDPCKICVCTENFNFLGKTDVQINCRHNPQCVVPSTTPRASVSTPIPLPVCDRLPQNVPFPHPHNPCDVCKCIVRVNIFGVSEPQIACFPIPGCRPDWDTESPVTITPPEPELCDRYPTNVIFPHPNDPCQVCKCFVQMHLFRDKKMITCYVKPNCIPTQRPPTPSTVTPWTTQPPPPEPTPGPLPDNAKCSPLPIGMPFQNPLNPCQVCICTESPSWLAQLDVNIECQENPQCVLPIDVTTLPPNIVTPIPLPACSRFPENVEFPHPRDACKVCKCSVLPTPGGVPEQHINCYTKPECVPKPTPYPLTTAGPQQATCAPLPTGQAFQNPMNPCQICVCTQKVDAFGAHEVVIECEENPQCVLPPDVTTLPPIVIPTKYELCKHFPENVVFPHPNDPCKLCKCSVQGTPFGPEEIITCQMKQECIPTPRPPPSPSTTTAPEPEPESCAPLPSGTPFQSPLNPCQICQCTERADFFGRHKVHIECKENPQCEVPVDVTTIPSIVVVPIHLPACRNFPKNVFFPHPRDPCQECKCTIQLNVFGQPEEQINCIMRPECLPTPAPTSTHNPEPSDLCDIYPINIPFDDPLNPCRVCMCTSPSLSPGQSLSPSILPQRQIQCYEKPECMPTPKPTDRTSDLCDSYPVNFLFDDPLNPCRVCMCISPSVSPGQSFSPHIMPPSPSIKCVEKPECLPTPEPTTDHPNPNDLCDIYPIYTPFDDPLNPCRACICTSPSLSPGQSLSPYILPQNQIHCYEKLECKPTPQPTDRPSPSDLCHSYPINIPFDDPLNPCRVCMCTSPSLSPGQSLPSHFMPPRKTIQCYEKPECLPTPEPITDRPNPNELCGNYPVNTQFDNPYNPCQVCSCYSTFPSASPPRHWLSPPTPMRIQCQIKPECNPSTPEPYTEAPTPAPEKVSCNPLPTGTPFQNPMNPCQVCVCTESTDVFGRPDVNIKCQENPQCVLPYDVTTIPPTPDTSPVPLPACALYPTNVEFPHPQDACLLCKCTVARNAWGVPDQLVTCHKRPECEQPSTAQPPFPAPDTPETWLCERYPPNTQWPHPQDPCRLCTCTVKRTIFGGTEPVVYCELNLACSQISTTTSPPWPPAPPGPLPGPYPHESCDPYQPNRPFQHPWDDCQVCVCREAISLERITIEVNCYTKQSCCIEPPFDVPGIGPGSSSINLVNPSSENWLGPISGNVINPSDGNLILPSDENWIGPTGGNIINPGGGNFIHPSDGNLILPSGENWIGPTGGNIIYSGSGNLISPSDGNLILPSNEIRVAPAGGNIINPGGDNLISPSNGNLILPSGENWIEPTGGNIIYSGGGDLISPSDGNLILPSNENWVEPAGGNIINPGGGNYISLSDRNLVFPSSENWIRPAGGNVIETKESVNSQIFIPTGEKWFGPPTQTTYYKPGDNWYSGGNIIESTGQNNRPSFIEPSGGNYFGPGGNTIDQWSMNGQADIRGGITRPKVSYKHRGNVYPPNRGNLIYRDPSGLFPIIGNVELGTSLEDSNAIGLNAAGSVPVSGTAAGNHHRHFSTKMRTKSGNPNDEDSGSEDEK